MDVPSTELRRSAEQPTQEVRKKAGWRGVGGGCRNKAQCQRRRDSKRSVLSGGPGPAGQNFKYCAIDAATVKLNSSKVLFI